jgi:hypothetical protein
VINECEELIQWWICPSLIRRRTKDVKEKETTHFSMHNGVQKFEWGSHFSAEKWKHNCTLLGGTITLNEVIHLKWKPQNATWWREEMDS